MRKFLVKPVLAVGIGGLIASASPASPTYWDWNTRRAKETETTLYCGQIIDNRARSLEALLNNGIAADDLVTQARLALLTDSKRRLYRDHARAEDGLPDQTVTNCLAAVTRLIDTHGLH